MTTLMSHDMPPSLPPSLPHANGTVRASTASAPGPAASGAGGPPKPRKKRKPPTCGNCGALGHTKPLCPPPAKLVPAVDYDDDIESFR